MTIRCQYKKGSAKGAVRNNPELAEYDAAFRAIWFSYVAGAVKMGREFKITPTELDVLIKQNCAYCGIPPRTRVWKRTKGVLEVSYNGLDRIDNTVGYLASNVVPCCTDCNKSKKSRTTQEFIDHARRIIAFQDSHG